MQVCMISPDLLRAKGITVHAVVQEERDLIVVFPHAYHSGFNHGFNIAEASNFGSGRWVEHGKRHRPCACADSDRAVHIEMEPFVERYQQDRLMQWRRGKDEALHPNDPAELQEVWKLCKEVVATEGRSLGDLLAVTTIPGEAEDLEQRLAAMVKACARQLRHFTRYREVLPEVRELTGFTETTDWTEETRNRVPEEGQPSQDFSPSLNTVKCAVRNAKQKKVKVAKLNKDLLEEYLRKLPPKPVEQKLTMKQLTKKLEMKQNKVKKLGFADISEEELLSKKMMKKCYFKHKFSPCLKCTNCLTKDCGRCWACK